MENRHNDNQRPGWGGYGVAIAVSAIGHAGLLAFALFVLPRLLHSETVAEQTYTVKMVDNIPAGDLGTHLPKLSGHHEPPPEQVAKAEVKPEEPKVTPPPPPPPEEKPPPPPKAEDDKNAVSLNSSTAPTPTPEPPPAVIAATPEPTAAATPQKVAEPQPTPEPKPLRHKKTVVHNLPKNLEKPNLPKSKKQPIQMADVQEQFRELQKKLLQQRIEQAKKEATEEDTSGDDEDDSEAMPSANGSSSSGPIAGTENIEGKGSGIGSGEGSAGDVRDLQFLIYYRAVQQKIKESWTFPGGSSDLTAAVEFGIGPDGTLQGVKISKGSGDPAFDDSVVRAIKRAAPFQPPPDKYRAQFADVLSTFKLGELKS